MIYLLEIDPFDPAQGKIVTLRFGSDRYVTEPNDIPANTGFDVRIADAGNYERHLFGQGRTRGDSDVGAGEIRLVNADGALDGLLDLAFDGRAFRLYGLASSSAPWSSRETVLVGTMEQVEFPSRAVSIRVRDRLALLKDPIQKAAYLGTTVDGTSTVAEGAADLKDTKKPLLFGRAFVIPPVTVDAFNFVYQVSASSVSAITSVRDDGVSLLATQDYPTLAALKAASILGGRYGTCLAQGLLRVGSRPAGMITIDAEEGSGAAQRSAARLAQRMVATIAGAVLDPSDVAALHAANPAECGIWLSQSEVSVLDAASTVLASVGASITSDRFGAFRTERLELPTGTGFFIGESMMLGQSDGFTRYATDDDGDGVPARSVTVRFAQAYATFEEDELKNVATSDPFLTFAQQDWRQEKAVSNANATIHPTGPELEFDTCFCNRADAKAEAERLLAIYAARRDLFRLRLDSEDIATLDLGDVATLTTRRFGMSAGRPMRVIGLTPRFANKTTDVELWG